MLNATRTKYDAYTQQIGKLNNVADPSRAFEVLPAIAQNRYLPARHRCAAIPTSSPQPSALPTISAPVAIAARPSTAVSTRASGARHATPSSCGTRLAGGS
ncbi:hypothetical protein QTN93_16290 [Sphingomonas aerolata]